jgi:hypothetical protein
MFKPKYSSDDLTQALQGLERMEALRDKALQDIRLTPALKDIRQGDYDRLTMAIKSRQKLILFMQERIMK